MSLSVIFAALLGKTAIGAFSKGLVAKGAATKASVAAGHHHGAAKLARKVAAELLNEAKDCVVDAAVDKADALIKERSAKGPRKT